MPKFELTCEQLEAMADPKRTAISLIYDTKGNVIGNSQSLARMCLFLEKAVSQFSDDIQKACDRLDNFEEEL